MYDIPGYIYAIAGKKETGPMATVDRFDLDKEKWSYVCSLESSLWDHAAASHEDKVGTFVASPNIQIFLFAYGDW